MIFTKITKFFPGPTLYISKGKDEKKFKKHTKKLQPTKKHENKLF